MAIHVVYSATIHRACNIELKCKIYSQYIGVKMVTL